MGVIAIVKEIAKDAKVRKEIESSVDAEYDVINYNSTNQTTDPNLNRSRLKITEEVFLMRSLII
jgi:hypothetical protein